MLYQKQKAEITDMLWLYYKGMRNKVDILKLVCCWHDRFATDSVELVSKAEKLQKLSNNVYLTMIFTVLNSNNIFQWDHLVKNNHFKICIYILIA